MEQRWPGCVAWMVLWLLAGGVGQRGESPLGVGLARAADPKPSTRKSASVAAKTRRPAPTPPRGDKAPLRTLKQILTELEEGDFGLSNQAAWTAEAEPLAKTTPTHLTPTTPDATAPAAAARFDTAGAIADVEPEDRYDIDVSAALASVSRVGCMVALSMLLSYLSVVPRNAPRAVYNRKYKQNLALLLATAAPMLVLSTVVFDPVRLDVNAMIKVSFDAFTTGFLTAYVLQLAQATLLRLLVFYWMQPELVAGLDALPGDVPLTALPWAFRELSELPGGLPKPHRQTLFVAQFVVDCLGAPLIEEAVKLWVLLHANVLPPTESKRFASVHTYLGYMLSSAMGLKLADNLRRVLLYGRPSHHQKTFFAFARGIFPVHELCAALTAIQLAKREVLGRRTSWLRVLLPAVALHGSGNFRGKKPLFRWASQTPWVEMQLQAWSTADDAPPIKVILNGCMGLFWMSFLVRTLIYLCRQYYGVTKEQRRVLHKERFTTYRSSNRPDRAALPAPGGLPAPPSL